MYDFDLPDDNSVPLFTLTKRGHFVLGAVAMLLTLAVGYAVIAYASFTDHKRTAKPLHIVADCSGLTP